MDPLIEVGIIYKNKQTVENKKKETSDIGVYDLFIEFPRHLDKSGKISMNTESMSDLKASNDNKFFISISFDFEKEKGMLYIKTFNKNIENEKAKQKPLSFNTKGEIFINKGFQLVTGDTSFAESSIHFQKSNGEKLQYYTSKHLSQKSN